MNQPRLFSRGQLSELAGVEPGALTFWLRHNLLKAATGGGNGTHRRFARSQVVVARLLVEARDVGLNIDALRVLSASVSDALILIEAEQAGPADFDALDEEQQRRANNSGVLIDLPAYQESLGDFSGAAATRREIESAKLASPDIRIANMVDKVERRGLRFTSLFKSLLVEEGMVHLFKEGEVWAVENNFDIHRGLPARCSVVFDMAKIFADISWPQQNPETDSKRG